MRSSCHLNPFWMMVEVVVGWCWMGECWVRQVRAVAATNVFENERNTFSFLKIGLVHVAMMMMMMMMMMMIWWWYDDDDDDDDDDEMTMMKCISTTKWCNWWFGFGTGCLNYFPLLGGSWLGVGQFMAWSRLCNVWEMLAISQLKVGKTLTGMSTGSAKLGSCIFKKVNCHFHQL